MPSASYRTIRPPDPTRHCALVVPSAQNWIVRPPEPTRYGARAIPTAPNKTARLPEPTWYGAQAIPNAPNQTVRPPEPVMHYPIYTHKLYIYMYKHIYGPSIRPNPDGTVCGAVLVVPSALHRTIRPP